jgi:arginase
MPAVDSPLPGGLNFAQATDLLAPLVHDPAALGLQITLYDPTLDPNRSSAAGLVAMLERAFGR